MSNVVEFIVKIKDAFGGPLADLTKETNASDNALTKLTTSTNKFKTTAAVAETQTKKTADSVDKLHDKLKDVSNIKSDGVKSYFSDLVNSIPPFLTNPIVAIGAGIGASLNAGLKNSQTKLEFSNILGKDAGGELFKSLSGVKSMLGDDTFDFGKRILNSGVQADKVVGTMKRLGDVANGNRESYAQLIDAYTEMRVEGGFNQEAFKKLGLLGFNPLNEISKRTGESVASLTLKMQAGKISVADVEKALESDTEKGGQFHGNLERINNSPMGQWHKMMSDIGKFGAMLGEFLMPIVSTVIGYTVTAFGWLADKLQIVVGWLKPLAKWAKDNEMVLKLLGSAIIGLVVGIQALTVAKTIWTVITGGLTTAINIMSASIMAIPVFGWILAAIAAIIAIVVYLQSRFEGFGQFFKNLWTIVKASFNLFVVSVKQGFESITYYMQLAWLKIKSFGQYIGELFSNIGDSLKLAMEFKFTEAKAKLTATITTEASKEIEQLDKSHQASQKEYNNQKVNELMTILTTPLKGVIKEKKETTDANAATTDAFGATDGKGIMNGNSGSNNKVNDGINAISGGGSKNIFVNIGKVIENSYITMTHDTKKAAQDLERIVQEELIRAIASASAS